MERRSVNISDLENASVPGWKLGFSSYSRKWSGGVPDILPGEKDDWVEGVIYTVDKMDLRTLDGYEGRSVKKNMEIGLYRRQHLIIKAESGWKTVITYQINRSPEYRKKAFFKPSDEYMKLMIEGAKEHELSEEYIEKVISWAKKGNFLEDKKI